MFQEALKNLEPDPPEENLVLVGQLQTDKEMNKKKLLLSDRRSASWEVPDQLIPKHRVSSRQPFITISFIQKENLKRNLIVFLSAPSSGRNQTPCSGHDVSFSCPLSSE